MKKKIIIILGIVIFIALISFGSLMLYLEFFTKDKIAVLTYHNITDSNKGLENSVDISVSKFESQIKYLHEHGYKSLSMNEFYEWKIGKKKLPRKSVLITFDDGWSSFYTKAIPILEKYNMKASVFVVWKYSENCTKENNKTYMNFDQIKDVYENHPKMEILSHSYDLHDKETADSSNYDRYIEDMQKVNTLSGKINEYYAYPYGHSNSEYIKALKDNKYKLAFTFGPYDFASKKVNNYQIPRLGVFESTNDTKLKIKLFLKM